MALNTDKFKKLARRWVGQVGSGGVADAVVTTIPLASTTNLPTDTAVVAVIDRVDANGTATAATEESVIGVVSGSNLVTCTRGVEGTAQAHSAGAVVEILVTAKGLNDLIDGLLVQHNQLGLHTNITACNVTASGTVYLSTGKNIQVNSADPWRTICLMPGILKPTTTSGCATQATVEAGTNDIDYDVLDFDKDSDENVFANFQMPDSWDAGVIQFRYIWTTAAGGAAETVTFELSGRSYADDDAIDQAVGTAVEVADTWIADGDVHISAWSGDVTLAGTPAAGELVHLEVMRDVSEDDLGGDARLIEIQIRYKQTTYSD